ncbi:hypothetical protein VOLCADRAFT_98062 [Volvox carteri f. nagariensis]|uniref:Uncharacterized protein n=1 Tax=Volvox carteri f. nagariensis TaxID=3068 RepID=D8UEC3_VOLCA|nr:uncharacterized protein VOLCADRAFT_98062 [Volvox carteri f. nagariensis]EFJ41979.1 hypothetical protein VOLCADRAFT_98062 [Volvox carteri f. nagariensis]|eukprot:XP_002957016.1 hypothetical protein VOLCADRAFT_98062 [Volvox carteri f. nagariensis]
MSKPSRPPPKVFASPRKKSEMQRGPEARGVARSKSIKAKLRKALAPYLTSTYLQSEIVKHFTKEFLAAHPPPENEDDLPAYVEQHLSELTRVTERWTGCVMRALDPLAHELEVDVKLEQPVTSPVGAVKESVRMKSPRGPSVGGSRLEISSEPPSGEGDCEEGPYPHEEDLDAPPRPEGGLTPSQIFGAVHLVSDVKVWQQILAAQRAEERRQHAIAELHLHHAARIIQRSWRNFVTQKKEDQARLDALVSPDVQAMLSAAAYKAMRDARNKLAVMKLRRSISRKYKGFGSTTPRDLDPIVRTPAPITPAATSSSTAQPSLPSLPYTARKQQRHGNQDSTANSRLGGRGRSDSGESAGAGGGGGKDTGSSAGARSFAARSAHIITRLVSMKDLQMGDTGQQQRGGGGGGGAEDGSGGDGAGEAESSRLRGSGAGVGGSGVRGGGQGEQQQQGRQSRGQLPEGEEEGEDDDDGEGLMLLEEEEEEEEEDSECASGSELDEGETAEAAMEEAEEVVQVAAKLAKAFMGAEDSDDDSDEDNDEDGDGAALGFRSKTPMGDEALAALTAVEAAAAAVAAGGDVDGKAAAAARMAALMSASGIRAVGEGVTALPGSGSALGSGSNGGPQARVHRGRSMVKDASMLRQMIAGALAAAAAPVLGRNGALAVAQMGLGDLLQLPGAKGLLPKAAAALASSRPAAAASGGKLAAVGRGVNQPLQPAQASDVKLAGPQPTHTGGGKAVSGGFGDLGRRGSDGGISHPAMSSQRTGPGAPSRKTISGDVLDAASLVNFNSSISAVLGNPHRPPPPRIAPLHGSSGGGPVTLPAVHANGGDFVFEAGGGGDAAAGWRISPANLPGGGGGGGGPRGSPTGVSAAAAAARATQPWTSARRHAHPPGAHTMVSSLPDPRSPNKDGGGKPRELNWLLPPINRGGPAGPPGGAAAAAAVTAQAAAHSLAAAATAVAVHGGAAGNLVPRVPSDSSMQRLLLVQGVGTSSFNSGGGGGGGGVVAGGPGAMAAAAAAAAVGRARAGAGAMGSSLDSSLQQIRQQPGGQVWFDELLSLVTPPRSVEHMIPPGVGEVTKTLLKNNA